MKIKLFLFIAAIILCETTFADDYTAKPCSVESDPPVDGRSCLSNGNTVIITRCSGDPCKTSYDKPIWLEKSRCKADSPSRPTAKLSAEAVQNWLSITYYANSIKEVGEVKLSESESIVAKKKVNGEIDFAIASKSKQGEKAPLSPFDANIPNCPQAEKKIKSSKAKEKK